MHKPPIALALYFPMQYPLLAGDPVDDSCRNAMMGQLHFLNKRLASTGYIALTDGITLADLAVYVTVSAIAATQVTLMCKRSFSRCFILKLD